MRNLHTIIWHCTATPAGRHVPVATIRKWHLDRGWMDIGYHYVCHLDGSIEPGRPLHLVGSHVARHNAGTIGCVYVGGVDANDVKKAVDTRTPAQKAAMVRFTQELASRYPSIRRIAGHNEYAAKACPSFDVRTDPLGNIPGFIRGIRK